MSPNWRATSARGSRARCALYNAQRLAHREEVVGPPALHEERCGNPSQAESLVMVEDLVGDPAGERVGRLAGRHPGEVVRQVGAEVVAPERPGPGLRWLAAVRPGRIAQGVEGIDVGLLLDPERVAALGQARGAEVEEAAVGKQRVDEVGPWPAGERGRDLQAPAARAAPRGEAPVEAANAVAQVGELGALAASVGDPGDADRPRPRDALVGEPREQVLGVARLPALVD